MRRGITPVVAIVLLLMMTVAAAGGGYSWVQQIQAQAQDEASQEFATQLTVQDVQCSGGEVRIAIKNSGDTSIVADDADAYLHQDGELLGDTTVDTTGAGFREPAGFDELVFNISAMAGAAQHTVRMDFDETTVTATCDAEGAARSCLDINGSAVDTGNGTYYLDPNGVAGSGAFRTRCEMATDGGGWTRVARVEYDFTPLWDLWSSGHGSFTDSGTYGLAVKRFTDNDTGEDLEFMFRVDGTQEGYIYTDVHRLAWNPTASGSYDTAVEQRNVTSPDWSTCTANLRHANNKWNWAIAEGSSGCAGHNKDGGFILHGDGDTESATRLYGLNSYSSHQGWGHIEVYVR